MENFQMTSGVSRLERKDSANTTGPLFSRTQMRDSGSMEPRMERLEREVSLARLAASEWKDWERWVR